jgi:VanZ family protein
MQADATPPRPSRWSLWAALCYLAFPIYGSLIPFRWAPTDVASAMERFGALLSGPLTIVSRADFAANVLLALPLALLWLGAVATLLHIRQRAALAIAALVVWLICSALAVLLEFSQIFFSGRQPALSDIVGQSLGAAMGVLAWFAVPRAFWQRSTSPRAAWRRAAGLYLVGLVVYGLLPLDLTVSRSEIVAKWTAGKVHLLPFATWPAQPLTGLIDFALDTAIWAAAAVLIRCAAGRATTASAVALVGLAAGLEAAQLLVMSRVVDVTDIVAAAVGVTLAGLIRLPADGVSAQEPQRRPRWGIVWPLLAAVAIVSLNTWPFDFVSDPQTLRPRLLSLTWMPFASYATATEIYLVTNVLRRLAIYAVFALLVARQLEAPRSRAGRAAVAALLSAGLAALVEGLQVMLPGRVVDTGDLLIAALAGGLAVGLWPGTVTAVRSSGASDRRVAENRHRRHPIEGVRTHAAGVAQTMSRIGDHAGADRLRWMAVAGVAGVLASALVAAYAPATPYNLRELLAPQGRPWPVLAASVGALALLGCPAWLARRAAPTRGVPVLVTLAGLVGVPLAVAVVLVAGVPRESVHDLVGTPVLGIWPLIELTARLAVLLCGVFWAVAVGYAVQGGLLRRGQRGGSFSHLVLHGLWVVPLWQAVVVAWAATDNLTELMAGGGGALSTACLLGYAALIGVSAGACLGSIAGLGRQPALRGLATLSLSLALGWGLASWGTEDIIIKYGRAFSALQFLLSESRETYLAGPSLWVRFAVAHLAFVALATVGALVAGSWMARARPGMSTGARSAAGDRVHV